MDLVGRFVGCFRGVWLRLGSYRVAGFGWEFRCGWTRGSVAWVRWVVMGAVCSCISSRLPSSLFTFFSKLRSWQWTAFGLWRLTRVDGISPSDEMIALCSGVR